MPSIRDLFTFYLKAEHLRGRSAVVHVESVTVEDIFVPIVNKKKPHLLIRFHGKKLALVCNKTQAAAFERITGTDDYSLWPGHMIMLTPAKAPTGQDTILVSAAPAEKPAPQAAAQDDGQPTKPDEIKEQEEQVESDH